VRVSGDQVDQSLAILCLPAAWAFVQQLVCFFSSRYARVMDRSFEQPSQCLAQEFMKSSLGSKANYRDAAEPFKKHLTPCESTAEDVWHVFSFLVLFFGVLVIGRGQAVVLIVSLVAPTLCSPS